MSARLLTPAEVREDLGPLAAGKTDDELIEIARRVRVVTTALLEHAMPPRADVAKAS